jgi:hypothetical protein
MGSQAISHAAEVDIEVLFNLEAPDAESAE